MTVSPAEMSPFFRAGRHSVKKSFLPKSTWVQILVIFFLSFGDIFAQRHHKNEDLLKEFGLCCLVLLQDIDMIVK